MAFTTINKPSEYFNTKLWTGTGASNSITGVNFQPDLAWIKRRNTAGGNMFTDVIRGVTKTIISNETSAEQTFSNGLTSFDSDGFTVGSEAGFNNSGDTFVGWNWLGANGTSANTDGSISSTVSANTTSGFSVVSYTGTGANATVGHGLGVLPSTIIIKARSNTGQNWVTWHKSFTTNNDYVELNTTDAKDNYAMINNTSNTTSTFSLTGDGNVNASGGTYIAYCFAEKQGYSKFGSYTGNGSSDGTFVYTGFKPAWFMVKQTNAAGNSWHIFDDKRDSFNMMEKNLRANLSNAEFDTGIDLDFLSNGVKLRNTDGAGNGSGSTYIYMAFAEAPLVGSNNVPCTAR